MKIGVIILIAALVLIGVMGCNGYNGLVKQDETVKKAWANVETEYQNRNDLVDNLVSTVKGAANFEKSTLEAVVQARARATSVNVDPENLTPEKIAEFQAAQGQMSSALSRLLVTVEAYPDIKATANFTQLQGQLEGIENSIRNARKQYNDAVNVYNTKVRSFPMNILSGLFGFSVKTPFEADEAASTAPKVNFEN